MKLLKGFFLKTVGIIIMSLVLLILGLGISSGQQPPKEKFPNRPITIIVSFGAGATTDVAVRLLASVAEKELGVPLIIVNKSGGGGTIGATELSRAKPDGYTIGTLTTAPMTVTPTLQQVAYDPFKDFDFICGFSRYLYAIYVKTGSPFKSIRDVVETARKNPGNVTFAATSLGSALGVNYMAAKENIKIKPLIATGGTELNAMLLGGHVDLSCTTPIFQWIESGEVTVLAVVSGERWPELPNVPTMKELGYDIDITGWIDLGAPSGVPKERLDIIYSAFKIASNDPRVKAVFKKEKIDAPYITGAELRKIYQKRAMDLKPLLEAMKAEQTKK